MIIGRTACCHQTDEVRRLSFTRMLDQIEDKKCFLKIFLKVTTLIIGRLNYFFGGSLSGTYLILLRMICCQLFNEQERPKRCNFI